MYPRGLPWDSSGEAIRRRGVACRFHQRFSILVALETGLEHGIVTGRRLFYTETPRKKPDEGMRS